ncbi:hypothetical protein C8J56DRAFT_1126191 [Mycena floridula]|nr:hypothetical protein C8J56DRAFT_1126191 [Mycena floridula]
MLLPDISHFKKGTSEATKDFNKELRHSLLKADAFHHKDIEALTGFAQSKIIADILETAFFEDATGLRVQFRQYFRPISENTLALVIRALEFLLNDYMSSEQEWGRKFEEKFIKSTFDKHLAHVNDWTILNPTVTQNIRMKLFKRLLACVGATDIDKPVKGLSSAV